MRTLSSFGIILAFLTFSSPAWAWGDRGHRMIADLAYERLTPHARAAVDRLTSGDVTASPGCGVNSFSDASVWSDCVRHFPSYRNQSTWHYDDIPLCGVASYAEYCAGGNCATAAIARADRALRENRGSPREQARALARLVHFVGDIHQPLHATDNADRGGNKIRIRLDGIADGASPPANLHALWDTLLVDAAIGTDTYAAVSTLRALGYSNAHAWSAGDVQSWIAETRRLGVTLAYGSLPVQVSCGAAPTEPERVDRRYVEAAVPAVRQQLAKAAVRLASLLNAIYP